MLHLVSMSRIMNNTSGLSGMPLSTSNVGSLFSIQTKAIRRPVKKQPEGPNRNA